MRSAKPGDSPSGAVRDVYPLRSARATDTLVQLDEYLNRIRVEVHRLLDEQPHLEGQDTKGLFSRVIVPTSLLTYESALRRAAISVLVLRAVDRSELADPFTGDAA